MASHLRHTLLLSAVLSLTVVSSASIVVSANEDSQAFDAMGALTLEMARENGTVFQGEETSHASMDFVTPEQSSQSCRIRTADALAFVEGIDLSWVEQATKEAVLAARKQLAMAESAARELEQTSVKDLLKAIEIARAQARVANVTTEIALEMARVEALLAEHERNKMDLLMLADTAGQIRLAIEDIENAN